ncbi:MAG: chorismate synthase [Eisenbergiella massiliensis]
MAGNTFGTYFRITTWGESHGKALGVVIDGCPAGLSLCEADIQAFLDRRKPGQTRYATPRKEADEVNILSGVFEGRTTGTPICLMVPNTSQRSGDYSEIASYYRPGHADYTFDAKYGFRDYRGGGRSSGRETIGRVAAGAVASLILKELGISICAYTKSIGPVSISMDRFQPELLGQTPTGMPDAESSAQAEAYLEECIEPQSAGGVVECVANGVSRRNRRTCFCKLDACLAKPSCPWCRKSRGNRDGCRYPPLPERKTDAFYMKTGRLQNNKPCRRHLGGISDGSRIVLRAHIKPHPPFFLNRKP